MLEPGKISTSMSALSSPPWYVAYFCQADAVVLVYMLSFFLPATTYYTVVNKPLWNLTVLAFVNLLPPRGHNGVENVSLVPQWYNKAMIWPAFWTIHGPRDSDMMIVANFFPWWSRSLIIMRRSFTPFGGNRLTCLRVKSRWLCALRLCVYHQVHVRPQKK